MLPFLAINLYLFPSSRDASPLPHAHAAFMMSGTNSYSRELKAKISWSNHQCSACLSAPLASVQENPSKDVSAALLRWHRPASNSAAAKGAQHSSQHLKSSHCWCKWQDCGQDEAGRTRASVKLDTFQVHLLQRVSPASMNLDNYSQ